MVFPYSFESCGNWRWQKFNFFGQQVPQGPSCSIGQKNIAIIPTVRKARGVLSEFGPIVLPYISLISFQVSCKVMGLVMPT